MQWDKGFVWCSETKDLPGAVGRRICLVQWDKGFAWCSETKDLSSVVGQRICQNVKELVNE